ncbi:hypothetical protein GCM10007897_34530 [Sphingobium jiangsuense]|uniref:Uncharacterized protein n=2 Tax=Sphingobium jiangsuense TaxID=870476 RepID=A0A7W6BQ64_9SPHN|nr:hypothetical protein [Sphingobium jiangsuense]MBB3927757.1 hypothetical protein [Sphingobium jiangsuense]GLT02050.1 hypothetical protein GCM10007897_34530 [Sphingobium jiangsuense]
MGDLLSKISTDAAALNKERPTMTVIAGNETRTRTDAARENRDAAAVRTALPAGNEATARPAREERSDDYLRIDVC